MLFGDKLKNLRINKGLTQKQLGDIIGVSGRVVGYYESNDRFPKDENILIKISNYFDVTLDYLLGLENKDLNNEGYIDKELEYIIEKLKNNKSLLFKGEPLDENTRNLLLKSIKHAKEVAEDMNEYKINIKSHKQ